MTSNYFLVDNNVLSRLTKTQRSSAFFCTYCKIPSEVLEEASDFPDYHALEKFEYKTSISVLRKLIQVMSTVPVDDHTLVDLYSNKGSADPVLVACALDAIELESESLFPRDWSVATDDHAVQKKCSSFGVKFLTSAELSEIIERFPSH